MMNDYQIRNALKHKILSNYCKKSNTKIIDEFSVKHGTKRIDLVIINDLLHGFEIKSENDTLYRLPEQAIHYNDIFDLITLIVSYNHAYEAFKIVPDWWGVKLVHQGPKGAIYFSEARRPKRNPSQKIKEVIKLLWRNEVLQILAENENINKFKSKTRKEIYERLLKILNKNEIHNKVLEYIKIRYDS